MPTLMSNGEFLIVRLGHFGQEAGWALETAGVAAHHAEEWIGQVQFVFGAGDGDVEEPSLLFFSFQIVERAGQRKHPVAKPDDKYRAPLLPFRLMDGAQPDEFVFL